MSKLRTSTRQSALVSFAMTAVVVVALNVLTSQSFVVPAILPTRTSAPSQSKIALPLYSILRRIRRSSDEDATTKKKGSSNPPPGYEFFQGDGSYVPNGMSREDYTKLKQEEIDKEKMKNYGAWGPRFKQTGVPDGDWMVMPNLWTAGRVNRKSSLGNDRKTGNSKRPILASLLQILRKQSASFILAYLLLDCFQIMFGMWKCKVEHMSPRTAVMFILQTLIFQKQLLQLTVMKLEIGKVAASVVAAPLINRIMERLNRSKLWSKRRIFLITLASALGMAVLWRTGLQFFALV